MVSSEFQQDDWQHFGMSIMLFISNPKFKKIGSLGKCHQSPSYTYKYPATLITTIPTFMIL